jgi:EF hand
MFAAIDDDQDGLISLEEYLVYNDKIAHGTTQEKNFITFKMIDITNSGRVSFDDFKLFWSYFIQLYGEALQTKLQCEEETIKEIFYQISGNRETFDFPRFENAKQHNPEIFEWLD